MARGKSVLLSNGREWANQSLAYAHFRELRDRYPPGNPIDDPDDHDDLCALLERYDASVTTGPSKVGSGVAHFVTRENEAHGGTTIGFWVVRTDGSETDFSFKTAVSGRPKDADAELVEACRESVYPLLADLKSAHFKSASSQGRQVTCEISGDPVNIYDARLDYAPTEFRDLVWAFRIKEGWQKSIPLGVLSVPGDGQLTTQFVDIDAMARFRAFHAQHAKLRVVARRVTRAQILASRSSSVRNPIHF